MNKEKEIIENLEKVLKELKKEKKKPKTTDEYLKEISEKLSKLLDKEENKDLEKLLRNPFQREAFPNTKPYIIPDPIPTGYPFFPNKPWHNPVFCKVDTDYPTVVFRSRTNYGPNLI